MPIKPPRLRPGDTIGIIAPASPPPDPDAVERSIAAVERFGFKPKPGRHLRQRFGFLAGDDRDRAADLMTMFRDPSVKALFCLRGGYGTGRILQRLDFAAIRSHPKILLGYSDLTALHCALLAKANLVSFHGPMLNAELGRDDSPEFTIKSCFRTLTETKPPGSILQGYRETTVTVLNPGQATGRLVGGNLSMLCNLIGTPWQPRFRGRILFLEDVGEAPYRYDRMLTHLLNAGLLQQVSGIAIGLNKGCTDPAQGTGKEYRQTVEEVIAERLLPLGVPLVTGLPIGHVPTIATLPLGLMARLDATTGDLDILEAGVE